LNELDAAAVAQGVRDVLASAQEAL
jgi:hypothetical protein